jgi:4-hydroxy-2-oxoheptanedioate aldolase
MNKKFIFRNKLKEKIKTGELAIGVWSHLGSPIATEIMANIGLDWILFDSEHAPFSLETIVANLRALKGTDCVALVRVPSNDPVQIKRILDLGVMGILVPDIKNKDDAFRAVQACKYPKKGIRGFAGTRASNYGLNLKYPEEANDEIMVIVHVESVEGINNIEEILSVEGIDALNFGPGDFSFDLFGVEGRKKTESTKIIKALNDAQKKLLSAADNAGIPVIGHSSMKTIGPDDLILMMSIKERIEKVKAGKPAGDMPSWVLH